MDAPGAKAMVVAVAMHAPPLLGTALANHARALVVEGLLLCRRQLGVGWP